MKNSFFIRHLILVLIASLPFSVSANNNIGPISSTAAEEIFREVNSPDKPAVAVVVLHKNKVIYEKAFGSANLEHKIPATVDTKFQVDTLAWEFIASAILMLEDQEKIKLTDDIRKYLPEIPDFGEKITINHLLSSTDGLHGYKVLKSLAGWQAGEPEQHKAILQLITRQKKLNFKPGEAFSPGGDTRLILLAKIVEVVSGQPFDAYCKSSIFTPLGMSNTLFVYDDAQPLNNTAVPYRNDGKGAYKNDFVSGKAPGPTNLYTSIRDLSIWRASLDSHVLSTKSLAARLDTPIRLDHGEIIKDISSISIYGQQHAGKERGISKIYQIGSSGGYASSIFRFPDQEITAIVLSSGLAYNGSFGMRLASTILENYFTEPATIDYDKIESVKLSAKQLQKYEGSYWSAARALPTKIEVKNGVLHYIRASGAGERALIPLGNSTFQMKIEGDDKYIVKFLKKKDGHTMHFMMADSDPIVFESYKEAAYTKNDLAQFAGTFHSEELNSSFTFKVENGILAANNVRTGTINLKPITSDIFFGNKSFMGGIKYSRGGNNEVDGFQVVVDEVRNLEFKKIRLDEAPKGRL